MTSGSHPSRNKSGGLRLSKSPHSPRSHHSSHSSHRRLGIKGQLSFNMRRVAELWSAEVDQQRPRPFVEGVPFTMFFSSLYLVSILALGAECQLQTDDAEDLPWLLCDAAVTAFFAIEALAKLICLGPSGYFFNYLDVTELCIVLLTSADVVISGIWGSDFLPLLRASRALRVGRVLRHFPELRSCLEDLCRAFMSMAWFLLLCSCLVLFGALISCRLIGQSDAYPADQDFDPKEYFGTFSAAIFTMTNLAAMQEYELVLRSVYEHQGYLLVLLMLYVAVLLFAVAYAIIYVIITQTCDTLHEGKADDEQEAKRVRMKHVAILMDVLCGTDRDKDGSISEEDAEAASQDERLCDLLKMVNLPSGFSIKDMVTMLDMDGDGVVTQEEFKEGMKRLIYCNDFQRQCLLMMQHSQLLKLVRNMHTTFQQELHQGLARVEQSIRQTIADELPSARPSQKSGLRLSGVRSQEDGAVPFIDQLHVSHLDMPRAFNRPAPFRESLTESTSSRVPLGELGTVSVSTDAAAFFSLPQSPMRAASSIRGSLRDSARDRVCSVEDDNGIQVQTTPDSSPHDEENLRDSPRLLMASQPTLQVSTVERDSQPAESLLPLPGEVHMPAHQEWRRKSIEVASLSEPVERHAWSTLSPTARAISSPGVVLADGGNEEFGNEEAVERWLRPKVQRYVYRAAESPSSKKTLAAHTLV